MTEGADGSGGRWRGWVLPGALLLLALALRTWVFGLVTVPTASMVPALLPGEIALYWKLGEPAVGDVVVTDRSDGVLHIKRVVATGGEEVEIARGRLYIDGTSAWEGAADEVEWTSAGRDGCVEHAAATAGEARAARRWRVIPGSADHEREVVPDDTIFVLGDNRANSSDSRQWGSMPLEDVRGVVAWVVWSRSHCGDLRNDRVGSLY